MALAAAAVFEGRTGGWLVGAAVVDHQLQRGSAATASCVAGRLVELGCEPVRIEKVDVGAAGGPEAAARSSRYEALERLGAQLDATVLLGHTLDDQAETVLLGLARGSGTRSLAGMAPCRGVLRRPLLAVSRDDTRGACQALGITVWDDPHNADARFARVRVRQQTLPALERDLGPGITEALARCADLARLDADALDSLAEHLHSRARTPDGHLVVAVLAQALSALRRRVLMRAALAAGAPASDLTAGHIEAMDCLVTRWHGQAGVDLPGRLCMRRQEGELRLAGTRRPDR